MKTFRALFLFFVLSLACSCQEKKTKNTSETAVEEISEQGYSAEMDSEFVRRAYPTLALVNVTTLKATEIVPALEAENAKNKNNIYSVGLLLAWDSTRSLLKEKIQYSDASSADFKLINTSHSYINALKKDECHIEVDVSDGIAVTSSFKNILSFRMPLDDLDDTLLFNQVQVQSFGSDFDLHGIISVLYYADDDHFIVSVATNKKDHEVLFAKGVSLNGNMSKTFKEVTQWIEKGKEQKKNKSNVWKTYFLPDDYLAIPNLQFNLAKDYTTLEGQTFQTADHKSHFVAKAYQNISFNLDKNGVTVQDFAVVVTDSMGGVMEIPKPKKLVFNRPFFIVLKRRNSDYPYFAMKVRNEELMIKK